MSATITLYTRNILETGTVTVTGTPDTGYPESRLYDRAISLFWKDTVVEAKTFKVDQGATGILDVDFLAIAKHNFNGKDMQWQHSTNDVDYVDAVTDWAQGDNNQIIKTFTPELNKRYWQVTLASMTNPQCSEIFMSYGYEFNVQANPRLKRRDRANVKWNMSVGGSERSTKFGDARRQRQYSLLLDSSDLTNFQAAMDDLDEYSLPFYIKDDEGNYWMCRLTEEPQEDPNPVGTRTAITIQVIEKL